ncbi:MAG: hypothetical protein FWG68_05880, partial [Defluviitaleaceae bacterium]|nr:hypothetical protein [Defluviitaleaceae bacterium]
LGVSVAWNSETGNVVLTFPGESPTGNVIMTVPNDLSEIENRLQNIEIMRENVLLFRDLIFRQFAFLRTFEELGRERLVTTFDILVETSQELGLFFEEWLWVYGEVANIAYEISRLVEDFSEFHWAMSLAGERFESIDRSVADLLEFLENIEEELRRIEQNLQSAADSEYHDIAELSQETQILTIYLFLRDVEGFVWQAEQVNRAFVANVEEISEDLDVAHSYMNELLEHSDATLFLTSDFIINLIRFLKFQSAEDEIALLHAVDNLTDLLLWYFGDIMRDMGELLGFERDFPEPSESLLWTVPAAIADLSEIFLLKAPQLTDFEFFALFRQLRDVEMILYELHITWPLSTIEILYQTFAIYQDFDEVDFIEENIRVFETDINEILNHWHGELSPDGLLMLEDVQAGIAEYFTIVADIISNVVAGSAAENLQAERVRILYDEIIPVLHELQNAVYWEIVFEFDGVSITLESPQTEIGFSEIMGRLWIMQEELGQVKLAISDFARGENVVDAAHILFALPLEIIQENWIIEDFRLLHDFAQNNALISDNQRAELRGFLIDLESEYSELLLILMDIQELIRNATNENFSETLDIVGELLTYLEELLPSMSNRIEQISEFLVEVR